MAIPLRENPRTVYLLPWLDCGETIVVGRARIAPLASVAGDLDYAEDVCTLAGAYRIQLGVKCPVSVMWLDGADVVRPVSDDDAGVLRAHLDVLAAAAIAENRYFDQIASPVSAAHFEGYFQSFLPAGTHVTVERRRRDGTSRNSIPRDGARFTVPAGAATKGDLVLNEPLLAALVSGIGSADPLDERIQRSIGPFLDGNRFEDFGDARRDLIGLGAAFEMLLEVTSPIGLGLGQALAALWVPYAEQTTAWSSHRGRSRTGPWVARWAEEFYDHRSSIHGRPARTATWHTWEHALIATVVWALAVKLVLATARRYELTDRDEREVLALEGRLAGGKPRWGALARGCRAGRLGARTAAGGGAPGLHGGRARGRGSRGPLNAAGWAGSVSPRS